MANGFLATSWVAPGRSGSWKLAGHGAKMQHPGQGGKCIGSLSERGGPTLAPIGQHLVADLDDTMPCLVFRMPARSRKAVLCVQQQSASDYPAITYDIFNNSGKISLR